MHYSSISDESLVLLVKKGETGAFEVLYQRYWRQLYGFAYRQLGVKEEAEEIVQELMLSLWQNREVSDIQDLRIYLFIAARNLVNKNIKAQMHLRKYMEFQLFQDVFESSRINEILTNEQLKEAVERVMKQLPEKTATVFRMSKIDEVPIKKIAQELGLTDKAVEYHITKSMKMLRQHLRHFHHYN
jgi:RNA polymerase sigma-70 factor (family 1)